MIIIKSWHQLSFSWKTMDLKSVENHIFNTPYIFKNGANVDLINYRMVYFKLWTVQYLINTL